jgi:PAS domain S-box-containing protein
MTQNNSSADSIVSIKARRQFRRHQEDAANGSGTRFPELFAQEANGYSEKIIQTVNQPLLVLDENLIVTLANPAFYNVFKLPPTEVIGSKFHCVNESTESAAELRACLLQVIRQGKWFSNFEFESHSPDGRRQFLLLNAQPLLRKTRKANLSPLILLSLQNVTERHEAEEVREHLVKELGKLAHELEDRVDARTLELQQVNAKLQTLSMRMLEAQELERRHLARELHDEIGQQITCLQILTEQQFALAPPPLKRALKETRRATKELLQTVRRISSELRPQLLDDFGVLAALEWHFKRFHKRTGIEVRLGKRFFQEGLLNSFLRNVVFRVTQEALTNIARHAHTNRVIVELSTRNGVCRLEVRDKGRGFNVKDVLQKGSFGLAGMRERVFLAGGTLKFLSAPGKGTKVVMELPLISPHSKEFDFDHSPEPS